MDATEPAAPALPWEGYFHRDAVLFVIDGGMHMHAEGEHETAFIMALRAALRFMHIKLVSSPKDYVGIMLWNTDASRMITPSKNPFTRIRSSMQGLSRLMYRRPLSCNSF